MKAVSEKIGDSDTEESFVKNFCEDGVSAHMAEVHERSKCDGSCVLDVGSVLDEIDGDDDDDDERKKIIDALRGVEGGVVVLTRNLLKECLCSIGETVDGVYMTKCGLFFKVE